MQSTLTELTPTKVKIFIKADKDELIEYKKLTLAQMAKNLKVPGFRAGKAPAGVVEKHVDQARLQTEFLEETMTGLYQKAVDKEKFRPVTKPEVAVKKFVPFSDLEYEITVEKVGNIKLTDYKKIQMEKPKVSITTKDVEKVLDTLKVRAADKKEVERVAKDKDEVWIDFKGVDENDKPINGADGKDYPLILGSKTFIPGFEENLVGLKKGDEKTFTLTFPKDYGVKALADKKVKFTANVKKVQEVTEPKLDDKFASKIGPFKTVADLKSDIKKQLEIERQNESNRNFANNLVEKITDKSTVDVPEAMISQQIEHNLTEFKRNLTYRGQTYEEFLTSENTTEEKYEKEILRPQAERQVKASLILAEISEKEQIYVTPEELEMHIQMLKGQYQDKQMQEQLDKAESRNDITSRIITDKVLKKLEEYATS